MTSRQVPSSTGPASAPGQPYFAALDTMRAVGALAVLTTHVAFWSGDYLRHGAWGTLLARLDVGVAIFFVLSGFLLSRPHLVRAAAHRPPPGTGRYFWHRFLRIVPLYLVTVVLALGFIHDNADLTWSDRWVSVAMLDTFLADSLPAGLTHLWSLAVEVTFYLLLPAIMLVAVGRSRRLDPLRVSALLVALVAISVGWHLSGDWVDDLPSGMPVQWLPAYLSWFAVGIAMALVHVLWSAGSPTGRLGRAAIRLAGLPGSCWMLAAGLMLVTATPLGGPTMLAAPTAAESTFKHVAYALVAALTVLPAVFAPPTSRFARAFSHWIPRHIGLISYGIFCLHLPVLHLVMQLTGYDLFAGHGLQIWGLTVALSLVAAELAHRLVENPAQRLRNLGRREAGSGDPASTRQDTTEASAR